MSLKDIKIQYNNLLDLKEENKNVRGNVINKLNTLFDNSEDVKECVSLAHTLNEVLDSSETSFERIIKLQQQEKEISNVKEFNDQALKILKSSPITNTDPEDIKNNLSKQIDEVVRDNPIRDEELKLDPTDI